MAMSAGQSVPKITLSMPTVRSTSRADSLREAIVVKLVKVGAGGTLDVDSRLGAHLPTAIHPSDAKTRITAAVGQADFQIRTGIHHSAKDEGGEGHGPVHQVANGVGQMVAARTLSDQRSTTLVDKHQSPHLLRRLPEGHEFGLIISAPIDLIIDHRSDQPELVDRSIQLSDGRRHVLHRIWAKPLKRSG